MHTRFMYTCLSLKAALKKMLPLLLFLTLIFYPTPPRAYAQNTFGCQWNLASFPYCTVSTNTCTGGDVTVPTLCNGVVTQAQCTSSSFTCSRSATNSYTCSWDSSLNVCAPVSYGCAPGFGAGSGCAGRSQSACAYGSVTASCIQCGGENQPCCGTAGSACGGGLYCNNPNTAVGTCIANNATCGDAGEPCCGGSSFPFCNNSALQCNTSSNICQAASCGRLNTSCCADGFSAPCSEGECRGGICTPSCGGAYEPCCSGSSCDRTDLQCQNGESGRICAPPGNTSCGGFNEACCSGNVCDEPTLACRNGGWGPGMRCIIDEYADCGVWGDACCDNNGDGRGETCYGQTYCFSERQYCERCGSIGLECCPGDACSSGECIENRCRDPLAGSGGAINLRGDCEAGNIDTAIGCIPITVSEFVEDLLEKSMGISGGTAFIAILIGAMKIILNSTNPEKITEGKDTINAALGGLLLIAFSVAVLLFFGINILAIPGFSR